MAHYYKKNLQGDVTAIVDSNGALKIGYKYDAWGNAASYCSNPNDLLSVITAALFFILNPFTYRGYFYDAESNIYYLQSRYYSPELGRFLNADAWEVLEESQKELLSANMYAYCINNPVMNTDPLGYFVAKRTYDIANKGKISDKFVIFLTPYVSTAGNPTFTWTQTKQISCSVSGTFGVSTEVLSAQVGVAYTYSISSSYSCAWKLDSSKGKYARIVAKIDATEYSIVEKDYGVNFRGFYVHTYKGPLYVPIMSTLSIERVYYNTKK